MVGYKKKNLILCKNWRSAEAMHFYLKKIINFVTL